MKRLLQPGTLRAKAVMAMVAIALLAAANVLTVQYLLARSDDIAATLNLAGKMRMLAQRAGLQTLAAPTTGTPTPLAQYQEDFASAWNALRSGGTAFGLRVRGVSAPLHEPLQALGESWRHYQTLLAALPQREHASHAQVIELLEASNEMLARTEALIDALVSDADRVQRGAAVSTSFLFLLDLLLLIAGYLLFTRQVLRPIQGLADQCRAMAGGDYAGRATRQTTQELDELAQALNTSSARIAQLLQDVEAEREAVARMQAMFNGLAQNSSAGIYMLDANKRFTYVNERFAQLLGYPAQELQAHFEVRRIFPDEVWPTVSSRIDERLSGAARNSHYESRARRADGTLIDVEIFGSAMRLGRAPASIGVLIDISERKRAEASMQRANIVYRSTRDAIIVTDAQGIVQDVNPAFTAVTGYAPADALGRPMGFLRTHGGCELLDGKRWEDVQGDGSWSGDIRCQNKSGEEFIAHLEMFTALDDEGRVNCRVGLLSDVTEERARQANIWRQAHFDHLTGLANRQMFEQLLATSLEHARTSGQTLALVFLDLDLFKEVNDTLAHDAGDALLQEVARRLLTCVRPSDHVARLGGDEFTLILRDVADEARVAQVCDTVLRRIRETYQLGEHTAHVSTSMGIAFYPGDARNRAELLKHADLAMYVSKKNGRNRCSRFTRQMLTENED